ncbi:uncharacterized protein si:ch211-218d20.15 isoform X2 [Kryptolebias marmoratus]|nr:uncharacterized protein si:ch211-218d20.15 isoform X2 [Kryptolebias marmoratus]
MPVRLSPEQVGLEMLCLCGHLDLLIRAQMQQFQEQLGQGCSPEESDTFQAQGSELLDQMLQCLEHLPKPMPQLEDYLDAVGLSAMFPRVEVFLIQGSPVDMLETPQMDAAASDFSRCLCCRLLLPHRQAEPAAGSESAAGRRCPPPRESQVHRPPALGFIPSHQLLQGNSGLLRYKEGYRGQLQTDEAVSGGRGRLQARASADSSLHQLDFRNNSELNVGGFVAAGGTDGGPSAGRHLHVSVPVLRSRPRLRQLPVSPSDVTDFQDKKRKRCY